MPLFVRKRLDGEGKADGSQYMICTGSVSRDPRIGVIPKNSLPKVEFGDGLRQQAVYERVRRG